MPLPTPAFEAALVDAWPTAQWCDLHVLLAVSGGVDSVALLRATVAVKQLAGGSGQLFVAHLNHGIRHMEAKADENWLVELCNRLAVPLEIGHSNVPALAAKMGAGLEAAARSARYQFLCSTAEKLGARFVALAHTADDQVETVIHRIIRGTGVAGLAGMRRARPLSPTIVLTRPFLALRRRDALEYLQSIGQDYRIDATNTDLRFTRNRIRNQLLPLLRSQFNEQVDDAILRLAWQADELQQMVTASAEELVQRSMKISPLVISIQCRELVGQAPLSIREACKIAWGSAGWPLQNMGFKEWQQIADLIASDVDNDRFSLPGGIYGERSQGTAYLSHSSQLPQGL